MDTQLMFRRYSEEDETLYEYRLGDWLSLRGYLLGVSSAFKLRHLHYYIVRSEVKSNGYLLIDSQDIWGEFTVLRDAEIAFEKIREEVTHHARNTRDV